VSIALWDNPSEKAPEALQAHASKLLDRLGTANRLVTDTFAGTPPDVAKVNSIRDAIKRLDIAYVTYANRATFRADVATRDGPRNENRRGEAGSRRDVES